jgi:hypothetical protein
MKIITSRPIIVAPVNVISSFPTEEPIRIFPLTSVTIDDELTGEDDYYMNADGSDTYLPFDAQTNLMTFTDETNERYFMSFDGEEFYNAKGEKIKGVFQKFGKGVVKVGKGVGKAFKKVGRFIVKGSKNVAIGVKKVSGKVKAGAKKLIHHKKKDKGGENAKGETKLQKRIREHNEKKDKRKKEIEDAKAKGLTPPPPIPNTPPPPTPEQKKAEQQEQNQNKPGGEVVGGEKDVFTEPLEKAIETTPKDKIIDVEGQKFSTEGIEPGKEVVVSTDQEGNKVVGVEYDASKVVAVTGTDGNIEYVKEKEVKPKMSTTTKVLIGVGGALVVGFILYFILRKKDTGTSNVVVVK